MSKVDYQNKVLPKCVPRMQCKALWIKASAQNAYMRETDVRLDEWKLLIWSTWPLESSKCKKKKQLITQITNSTLLQITDDLRYLS